MSGGRRSLKPFKRKLKRSGGVRPPSQRPANAHARSLRDEWAVVQYYSKVLGIAHGGSFEHGPVQAAAPVAVHEINDGPPSHKDPRHNFGYARWMHMLPARFRAQRTDSASQ
jgi:hypothetical protein